MNRPRFFEGRRYKTCNVCGEHVQWCFTQNRGPVLVDSAGRIHTGECPDDRPERAEEVEEPR